MKIAPLCKQGSKGVFKVYSYDYLMAVADDVLAVMFCAVLAGEINPEDFIDLDELTDRVHHFVAADKFGRMTGISNSLPGAVAERYVRDTPLCVITCAVSAGSISEKWLLERKWSEIDTGLRMYVLDDAIDLALNSMGARNLYLFSVEYQSVLDGKIV